MENGENSRQTKRPGKKKAEEKMFGEMKSLKGYLINQGIRDVTHMHRVEQMLR